MYHLDASLLEDDAFGFTDQPGCCQVRLPYLAALADAVDAIIIAQVAAWAFVVVSAPVAMVDIGKRGGIFAQGRLSVLKAAGGG
ncbi:hypothetical protein [Acidisoma sp. C75]